MILQKETRKKTKLRLNLSAPSGAGKTYSALLMAKGLIGDWEKIAVIDTENGSASLYENLGPFNVIELAPPFSPERYIQAIDTCLEGGMECIIIDSSSHEWSGPGGCLESNDKLAAAKFKGNTWAAWSETTPRHDNFVSKVLHSPLHIITCTRSKMETVQEGGKVKKLGMMDIQRSGWEYELTVSLLIDRDTHTETASKDRTELFTNEQPFVITERTGELIREWCNKGITDDSEAFRSELRVILSDPLYTDQERAKWEAWLTKATAKDIQAQIPNVKSGLASRQLTASKSTQENQDSERFLLLIQDAKTLEELTALEPSLSKYPEHTEAFSTKKNECR